MCNKFQIQDGLRHKIPYTCQVRLGKKKGFQNRQFIFQIFRIEISIAGGTKDLNTLNVHDWSKLAQDRTIQRIQTLKAEIQFGLVNQHSKYVRFIYRMTQEDTSKSACYSPSVYKEPKALTVCVTRYEGSSFRRYGTGPWLAYGICLSCISGTLFGNTRGISDWIQHAYFRDVQQSS